jgi:hypothetical protein
MSRIMERRLAIPLWNAGSMTASTLVIIGMSSLIGSSEGRAGVHGLG